MKLRSKLSLIKKYILSLCEIDVYLPSCLDENDNILNKFFVFLDMLWSMLVYKAFIKDYYHFEFRRKSHYERKKYITIGLLRGKVAFVNDQSKDRTLSYKNKEYHLFAEYIGRDYLYLTDASFDQFVDFCKNKTCFFTKPNKGTHGDGAQKIKLNANADLNKIYIELKDKNMIVEDYIEQIKELAEIHQNSLNTIRVNTIFLNNKVNIITALIRFGNNNSCVDNVSSGGMAASIDINTGIINSFAKDYNLNEFIMHPITNKQITGLTIPHWDAVKKLVIKLAPMTPENMYVAWDIAITETVPVLVEGNPLGGFRIQQMPRQEGVKKLYEPFIKF